MCRDEFISAKNIIKAVEGICDEKIVVITGKKRVKESGNCKYSILLGIMTILLR